MLLVFLCHTSPSHIHLTAEDGLEGLKPVLLALRVDIIADIEELLYAEHVAMVCNSHATHAIVYGLSDKLLDWRLAVKYGVVCMYVQMDEVLHFE